MTSGATSIDAARVELLLNELRLPGVKAIWPKLAAQSDKEGWPAARFLAALAEYEAADRTRRRIERHMVEASCNILDLWTKWRRRRARHSDRALCGRLRHGL